MRLCSTLAAIFLLGCRSDKQPADTSAPIDVVTDGDSDGFSADEDCDDADASTYPGADEICDGVDNDCDGTADEGVTSTFYTDADGDGFGDPADGVEACEAPSGTVSVPNDCDDDAPETYPGAAERCDEADNDCDGEIDEDVQEIWYADADDDSFGDADAGVEECDPPPGYVSDATDCDDLDRSAHPGAEEVCDEADNDCDGTVDEDVTATYYQDTDGDSFGVSDATTEACSQPTGFASRAGDCDDTSDDISPNAVEVCDSIDNDCDGDTDEDDAADADTFYADDDSDGYGDASDSTTACAAPSGYTSDGTDCDDSTADANPGEAEVCDDIDNDCDGEVDEQSATDAATWYADSDGDGYGGSSATVACSQPSGFADNSDDCDDGEALANPGEPEVCDDIDNDCDGDTDEGLTSTYYADADGDGYGAASYTTEACAAPTGYTSDDTDCDDSTADANPGASEVCDEIDNDCDGELDEGTTTTYYLDYDSDGYGDVDRSTEACAAPSGYVSDDTDCDDGEGDANPGEAEVCDEIDNDCDGGIDEGVTSTYYADADGDGYGDAADSTEACAASSGTVSDATDCDDSEEDANPGEAEVCDEIDNDCDGDIDEDGSSEVFYADADGDGYGDPSVTAEGCEAPSGYISDATDCDDSTAAVSPGASEVADGLDNDCDGVGLDGSYEVTADANLGGGVWEFTRLEIASGVTVTATGASPVEVYVIEDAVIDGTIDLSGADGGGHGPFISTANAGGVGGGGGGADGGAGSCYYCADYDGEDGFGDSAGGGGVGGGAGGGGAGAGNAVDGDDGYNGICTSARCGSYYTIAGGVGGAALSGSTPELLAGGGGGGGGYGGADNGDGGGGGGGGGALYLEAASIEVAGTLDCSGGTGGSDGSGYDGGSGGGGAGGTLWLVASSIDVSGLLQCSGGAGGTTTIGGTTAQGGYGGDGSDGVIWFDAASITVSGSASPSYSTVP